MIDADYKLFPRFLTETVSILEEYPETALVQTPQNLLPDENNEVERVSAYGINGNWQILRRGNAQDDSIFWGGTNCTIRRSALESIKQVDLQGRTEYVSTKNITEDLYTSLLLIQQNWKLAFLPQPLAAGMPINNLADHFTTFWRYVEGTTEASLELTIPYMIKNPQFARSKQGIEFLSHAILGFMGFPIIYLAVAPMLAELGINFPPLHSAPFLILFFSALWLNSRSAKMIFKQMGARSWDHIKGPILMIMHAPTYIHATITAIYNVITGRRAQFARTPKDGERSVVPLKYLLPLISLPTINYLSFSLCFSRYLGGESGQIHSAVWSLFNASVLTYGLYCFNGLKNTWSDLKVGFRNLFR